MQNTADHQVPSNPRDQIKDIYISTIQEGFHHNRPIIKLINFGTGSGKTHQFFESVFQVIEEHPDIRIIGLYIAPLREHLKQSPTITFNSAGIPLYILYSEESKTEKDLLERYGNWIPSLRKNQLFKNALAKKVGAEKAEEAFSYLGKADGAVSDYVILQRYVNAGNDILDSKLNQARYAITGSLEKFLDITIRAFPDENLWPVECLELVRIYYPLFLLRNRSGILLMTYKKFETTIPYFVDAGRKWIKRETRLDQYIHDNSSESCRFIVAFDEQEDGYRIMLEEQIDVILPKELAINNALSSIYREFSLLFSPGNKGNRAFLHFIKKNPGAMREWTAFFEKGKPLDEGLLKMADTFNRLTDEEGNSPEFLKQTGEIEAGIEYSFREIANTFDSFGREPVQLDFDKLSRVLATFESNRALMIPHKVYVRYAEDLMNIFAYNNLYIYNIDVLKNLVIRRKNSGHVLIDEQIEPDTVTVAELVYSILVIRMQIEAIRKLLGIALDADDSQSRSLGIWSKQINRLQDADASSQGKNDPNPYLNRDYVYTRVKSIINIMEISRYQNPENNLIHSPLREISIGSTAIITSPEHRILSILKDTSNTIFFISATGGVYADLATSFDLRYLEDSLRDEQTGRSTFTPMVNKELVLSEEIRAYRRQSRAIFVNFFDDKPTTFPNTQTWPVVERFEQKYLKAFIEEAKKEHRWFGSHKIQELQNFIRFLFYLYEDDSIREVIAFTQTLTHIRQLIKLVVRSGNDTFVFRPSEDHPGIYYVEVHHASYDSPLRIKLILYEAQFNKLYRGNAVGRSYLDELVERDGEKIFFISAYQSASKGLNPTIKRSDSDQAGKDFDALVLLMDKYYSEMGPGSGMSADTVKGTTHLHFTLMKNLVSSSNAPIEIKDFNQYLTDPKAKAFRDLQHLILMGKGILQAIGRTERRDAAGQIIKLFVNEESRRNLVNYYRYLQDKEPGEIRKLSVNNHEVFLRVMEEERKRTIQEYDQHVVIEIDATRTFQDFRKQMLDDIDQLHVDASTKNIVKRWELLRDPIVFCNPAIFLEKLRKSGLFPPDFIASLFYQRDQDQPEFVPYLADVYEDGIGYQIVSDSLNGKTTYPYLARLYPDFLKMGVKGFNAGGDEIVGASDPSTDHILQIYRGFIPEPELFEEYIPRPRFFYDVLYPSLAENIVAEWIKGFIFEGRKWTEIKAMSGLLPLSDFKRYHRLFERFDLFFTRGSTLYCIDVKAWSEVSGYRLSQKTIDKAMRKLDDIRSDYPEYTEVRGLLLNLHMPAEKFQKISPNLYSGSLIYLDHNQHPVASDTLHDFLLNRGK